MPRRATRVVDTRVADARIADARGADAGGVDFTHRRRHRALIAIGVVLAVLLAITIVLRTTPWPSALLIRSVFEADARNTVAEMNRYVPDTPISEKRDLQYGDGSAGSDTTLDVFRPAGQSGSLPTVVWVHGGAWISGSKANVEPYLKILAGHGYTTVGVNYTLGPEAAYPTAVVQLNQALGYLNAHADDLGIDANQIVLAGDSAGAQLASQLAAMSTNPQYAELLGITPALSSRQLAGTILNCGVYDMTAMSRIPGLIGWGFQVSLWAYTGTQDWSVGPAGSTMSTEQFVTADFPETFLSGGNGDGLTWMESVPMYETLERAGVDVTTVFWPEGHNPELPHEYQFHLHYPEARHALAETLAFLDRVTVHE